MLNRYTDVVNVNVWCTPKKIWPPLELEPFFCFDQIEVFGKIEVWYWSARDDDDSVVPIQRQSRWVCWCRAEDTGI